MTDMGYRPTLVMTIMNSPPAQQLCRIGDNSGGSSTSFPNQDGLHRLGAIVIGGKIASNPPTSSADYFREMAGLPAGVPVKVDGTLADWRAMTLFHETAHLQNQHYKRDGFHFEREADDGGARLYAAARREGLVNAAEVPAQYNDSRIIRTMMLGNMTAHDAAPFADLAQRGALGPVQSDLIKIMDSLSVARNEVLNRAMEAADPVAYKLSKMTEIVRLVEEGKIKLPKDQHDALMAAKQDWDKNFDERSFSRLEATANGLKLSKEDSQMVKEVLSNQVRADMQRYMPYIGQAARDAAASPEMANNAIGKEFLQRFQRVTAERTPGVFEPPGKAAPNLGATPKAEQSTPAASPAPAEPPAQARSIEPQTPKTATSMIDNLRNWVQTNPTEGAGNKQALLTEVGQGLEDGRVKVSSNAPPPAPPAADQAQQVAAPATPIASAAQQQTIKAPLSTA